MISSVSDTGLKVCRGLQSVLLIVSVIWLSKMNLATASTIGLPPSPEFKPVAPRSANFEAPPLDPAPISKPRLRSIANYSSFRPHALACSSPLVESTFEADVALGSAKLFGSSERFLHGNGNFKIPLGAVAGSFGVTVFRLSSPHVPVMVLNHSAQLSGKDEVTALSFQPYSPRSLYLAAARGTGVLVWDISGHSLSPLWARLGSQTGSETNSQVVSLAWKNNTDGSPCLLTMTRAALSLWDLRQSTGLAFFKPSLRFGGRRNATFASSSYLQVACSKQDECAAIDSSGQISFFDTRMTDRPRNSGALAIISAFRHAGAGIECQTTTLGQSNWVSWGVDAPESNAIVKVWSESPEYHLSTNNSDDPGTVEGSVDETAAKTLDQSYRLVGKCSSPNLACARVCPDPVEDSIVTIGLDSSEMPHWQVDLWRWRPDRQLDETYFEKEVSFQAGVEAGQALASAHGKGSTFGVLCASELAISTSSFRMNRTPRATSDHLRPSLILCSLTTAGFVFTHAIPEAIKTEKWESAGGLNSSIHLSSTLVGRHVSAEAEPLAIDAARIWAKSEDDAGQLASNERRVISDRDNAGALTADEALATQFDIDVVPVAYAMSTAGIPGPQIDFLAPNLSSVGTDEGGSTHPDGSEAITNLTSVDAKRIPCPRLCGASFGGGIGGLAVYHNGDVRRMWHWLERSDPAREENHSDLTTSPLILHGFTKVGNLKSIRRRDYPRTYKDLLDMTGAAQEAKWGEQDASEASSGDPRPSGDQFFDEDSEASTDGGEELMDEFADGVDMRAQKGMYDSYFKPTQRPINEHSQFQVGAPSSIERVDTFEDEIRHQVGPSSDLLAPTVSVSYVYQKLALSNQNIALALQWKLGDLSSSVVVDSDQGFLRGVESEAFHEADWNMKDGLVHLDSPRKGHVGFRLPAASPDKFARPTSSQFLITRQAGDKRIRPVKSYADDDQGVHGGEYGVRPSMQESMVFLKKFFTHSYENVQPFPLSPPESRWLPNNFVVKSSLNKRDILRNDTQLGVYTLRIRNESQSEHERLLQAQKACLYNARVCERLNEVAKGKVWEILADIVDGHFLDSGRGSDGWGGLCGGAFASNFVNSVLDFYESLGDVQMLATIVCVFRERRYSARRGAPSGWTVLPSGQEEKYDSYLRQYAELLYLWGLLIVRAEINKRLFRFPSTDETNVVEKPADNMRGLQSPGLALVFTCPRCSNETEFGSNFCQSCQDYAFRCVLCDAAVRGLFTVCDRCGHGGHVQHLKDWFMVHDECPAGCGCRCATKLSSQPMLEQVNFVGALG